MELADRLLVLAVEKQELAKALVLAASRVPGVGLALHGARQDPQIGQASDERVGRGLEHPGDERPVGVGGQARLLAGLWIHDGELAGISRGGKIAHDRLGEGPDSDVLRRAADENRSHQARPDGLAHACRELVGRDLLALEVLGQDVVVGLGRRLEQLVAPPRDLSDEPGRNRDLDLLAALHLPGLPGEDVDEACERIRGPDRHVQRRDLLSERDAEPVHGLARVRVLAIALAHEEEGRAVLPPRHGHCRFEPRLDVARRIDQQDGRVGRRKALRHLGGEVRVAGSVDQLHTKPVLIE